jgi:hypothetical protein
MTVNNLLGVADFIECHDGDETFMCIGPATFRQDFGPWSEGEKVDNLTIDYVRGYLEECDANGSVVRKCAIKLVVDCDRKPLDSSCNDDE